MPKGKYKRFAPSVRRNAVQAVRGGELVSAVARRIGVSQTGLRNRIAAAGKARPRRAVKPVKAPAAPALAVAAPKAEPFWKAVLDDNRNAVRDARVRLARAGSALGDVLRLWPKNGEQPPMDTLGVIADSLTAAAREITTFGATVEVNVEAPAKKE